MKIKSLTIALVLTLCNSVFMANAVELPEIFSDNAVLQQNSNATLWGWSKPGKAVKVSTSWNGKSYTATTDSEGKWKVAVATPAASFTPYSITFNDGNKTTISNILIGEVWLCSGQSNMEMPLRGFWTQPIENANKTIAYSGEYPGIRVVTIPKTGANTPNDKVPGKWKLSNPENAPEFTALGYFFAQSLTRILNVPVGIISCAWGGSKVEGWIPREKLDTYPEWNIEKELNDTTISDWQRPLVMYNGMLHPIIGYTVKGFLWNQGESNVGKHQVYHKHLADMVKIWREQWGQGEIPFYSVEIPGWSYSNPEGTSAALLRESQQRSASIIPNSAVICTSDLVYPYEVEDIHACQKQPLGERMAFTAAARTYGIKGISCESPRFESMKVEGNSATLHFKNAADGFTPNRDLKGFEVAGADKKFFPAQATEIYDTRDIKVTCDSVKEIVAVRYCFKNFAVGRVHNLMGLPIVPFRTDNWDE